MTQLLVNHQCQPYSCIGPGRSGGGGLQTAAQAVEFFTTSRGDRNPIGMMFFFFNHLRSDGRTSQVSKLLELTQRSL